MTIHLITLSLGLVLSASALPISLTHDPQGRLTREEYADGTLVEHVLDVNGNILDTIVSRPVELTIQVDPPGAGTVTGAGRYRRSTTQALTATPGSAFDFVGWKRPDGSTVSTDANCNFQNQIFQKMLLLGLIYVSIL